MTFWKFCVYTFAGSAFWCGVLAYVSVAAGKDERLMRGEIREITIWIAGAAVALGSRLLLPGPPVFAQGGIGAASGSLRAVKY